MGGTVRLLAYHDWHDWHDWHVLFDFCCFFANYILFFVCIGAFLGPLQDELKYVLVLWSKMFLSTAGADAVAIVSASAGSLLLHDAPHPAKKDEHHASHIEAGRSHIRVLSMLILAGFLISGLKLLAQTAQTAQTGSYRCVKKASRT